MIELPAVGRNKAIASGAGAWVDLLADLVSSIEADWKIAVGRQYDGGTEAFVAEAVDARGRECVLKLLIPRDDIATHHEMTVLTLAGGRGCVELYRQDEARGALLLERLGPSLYDLSIEAPLRHDILCDVASLLWQPAPDSGLPTGAEKAAWLQSRIAAMWEELDRPCSEQAVAHALSCADRRIAGHNDERAGLVHGDVHQWNALSSGDGFKLVDPDGLLAEPEYDLGIIMREDPQELLQDADPRRRARRLAARAGLDADAIWEWGVVERVSTGLLATKIDLQPVGAEMLAAADFLASQWSLGRATP